MQNVVGVPVKLAGFAAREWKPEDPKRADVFGRFVRSLGRINSRQYAISAVKGAWNVGQAASELLPSDADGTSFVVQSYVRPFVEFLFGGYEFETNPEMAENFVGPLQPGRAAQFIEAVQNMPEGPLHEYLGGLVAEITNPSVRERGLLNRARFMTVFVFGLVDHYVRERAIAAFPSPQDAPLAELKGQMAYAIEQNDFDLIGQLNQQAMQLRMQPPEQGDPRVTVDQTIEYVQECFFMLADAMREFYAEGFEHALLS